jgi:hypothetical protein
MQGPTETIKSRSCFFVFLFLSMLVLSGCGAGSSKASTSTQPAQPASVNISISPAAVLPGQSATLTWSSQNTTTCTASGAWSGVQANSGSATVILQEAKAQSYTLTCTSPDRWIEQTAALSMEPSEGACAATAAVSRAAHKRTARRPRVTGAPS